MNDIARRLSILAACAGLILLAVAATAQEDQAAPLEEWQQAELQSLVEVVSAALQGQLVPTEQPFEMKPDFLKGADGNTYVPFTLTVDPAKVGSSSLAMYLFVTEHAEAALGNATAENEQAAEPPPPVFEDAYFVDVSARAAGDPITISRAFTSTGGEYDVFIALRDSAGGPAEEDQPANAATVLMLKEEVTVPDLWTPQLMTSSVIVADVVEPMTQPLTPEQQILSPYSLGTTRIVPKNDRSFGKQEELSLIFLVYNTRLGGDQKPDVTIEYNFHTRAAGGEEFFNKTNPQQFNAQTLPPGFDMSLGHQIVAGQSVPLTLFPAGDYRLEITVTDNAAGATVTQNVNFTVRAT